MRFAGSVVAQGTLLLKKFASIWVGCYQSDAQASVLGWVKKKIEHKSNTLSYFEDARQGPFLLYQLR
jgi:hypothetical protein